MSRVFRSRPASRSWPYQPLGREARLKRRVRLHYDGHRGGSIVGRLCSERAHPLPIISKYRSLSNEYRRFALTSAGSQIGAVCSTRPTEIIALELEPLLLAIYSAMTLSSGHSGEAMRNGEMSGPSARPQRLLRI